MNTVLLKLYHVRGLNCQGILLTMQVLILIHWFWIHSSKIQSDEFTSQVYSLQAYFPWMCVLSHVRLFVTPWTAACQAPLPTRFSRQEDWSGLPCPLQGTFPSKDQTCISFVSCTGKQVLHWATCFPISTDLNIWVISTDSFHWSFFFFLLSVGQVFLFLPTSNNLGLYPRYCKWHVLETLDSVLLFQRKILFVFAGS